MIMLPHTFDAVIVGAGPAGSSAAFDLALQGAKVALVEKAVMPRYKTCGGGLVYRALKLLPIDVSGVIDRECQVAELNLTDSRLHFRVERDYPLVSMTMRENLDHAMFRAAAQAGATVMDDCRVSGVASHNGMMQVKTSKGDLLCRFVVGADGARSVVARSGGWVSRLAVAPLVEWEVSVADAVFSRFSDSARFEFGHVPAGYAWIFPKKRHLSVGLGGYTTGKIDLKSRLDGFLKSAGIDRVERVEQHGYFIPMNPRNEGFVKDRVLLAGDAAGFVDPVTGEGITYAILSGKGAAKALIEGDFLSRAVRDAYLSELSVDVLRELRWGKLLAALLYRSARIRTLLFRQYGDQLTQAFADVITGKTSYSALCKKHVGLKKLFLSLKVLGIGRNEIG
jgi:geranylgeranyl reductase family protein